MSALDTTTNGVSLSTILVATDLSESTQRAMEYASLFAHRHASRVHVLHVLRPTAATQLLSPQTLPNGDWRRRSATDKLRSWADWLDPVPHETWLRAGNVAEVVKDFTQEQNIDLIVVGTSGRTGLNKLLFGSVAEQIFRGSRCAVLTVGPRVDEAMAHTQLRRIIYAVDPLEESHTALDYAVALAREHGAVLTLLYVMRETSGDDVAQEGFAACRKLMSSIVSEDEHLPTGAECRIEFSNHPVRAIVAAARAVAADLIVMDVRADEAWTAHLADNAYRVIASAPCPVLTVRTAHKRTGDNLGWQEHLYA